MAISKELLTGAVNGALVSRGNRKGMLKATCPKSDTLAAGAWQAMMGHANPYKMGLGIIMFFSAEQSEVYRTIDENLNAYIAKHGKGALRGLDRDSAALTAMGAW